MTRPEDINHVEVWRIALRMSHALTSVADLSDLQSVRIALRHAGHSEDLISDHLDGAVEIAHDRRVTQRMIGDPFSAEVML